MVVPEHLEELIEYYQLEYIQYQRFLEVSRRLNKFLSSEGEGDLSCFLQEQGAILKTINELDERAGALKKDIAQELGQSDVTVSGLKGIKGVEQFKDILKRLSSLLSELEEVETQNKDLLEARLKKIKGKVEITLSPEQASKAYKSNHPQSESSFDKKR